ncbi:MAG: sulfite exporter TauE/SafE family protein [Rhodocyclaceae bacterium]|nr:sulfite exporter TauE/SafE family protein [Rhodocyclaceae bacterium]
MMVHFATAGLEAPLWLPPLAGLLLAFLCSMVGISGAFLLMPFQLSVLGFASPSASATNLVYNLVSIPGALWRYQQEGRLWWTLALWISMAGAPGVWLGAWIRTHYLFVREDFEIFVAFVLGYLGLRLFYDILKTPQTATGASSELPARVPLSLAAFAVGVIGAIYGIGGGSFMVPILVSFFRLPLASVAGATLTATFLTSLVAVVGYALLPAPPTVVATPDWALGALFGIGGLVGGNLGARCQRFVPQRLLKGFLALILLGLALRYVLV